MCGFIPLGGTWGGALHGLRARCRCRGDSWRARLGLLASPAPQHGTASSAQRGLAYVGASLSRRLIHRGIQPSQATRVREQREGAVKTNLDIAATLASIQHAVPSRQDIFVALEKQWWVQPKLGCLDSGGDGWHERIGAKGLRKSGRSLARAIVFGVPSVPLRCVWGRDSSMVANEKARLRQDGEPIASGGRRRNASYKACSNRIAAQDRCRLLRCQLSFLSKVHTTRANNPMIYPCPQSSCPFR